jgi:AcrR family transcriptional regulator
MRETGTKRLQPSPGLLERVDDAFLRHGYGALSMLGLAKACNLSARALYYYFPNKEEAFRASVQYSNDVGLNAGFAAGRAKWANGGAALDVLSEILSVRYGMVRRKANASPHVLELTAEVFKRCNDIVTAVALYFEAELAKIIVELGQAGLIALRADLTPDQAAKALANGARGVNQRLPPLAPDELAEGYREMCRFILYGCADTPTNAEEARGSAPPKTRSSMLERRLSKKHEAS